MRRTVVEPIALAIFGLVILLFLLTSCASNKLIIATKCEKVEGDKYFVCEKL